MVEGAPLLREYGAKTPSRVRIPLSPPILNIRGPLGPLMLRTCADGFESEKRVRNPDVQGRTNAAERWTRESGLSLRQLYKGSQRVLCKVGTRVPSQSRSTRMYKCCESRRSRHPCLPRICISLCITGCMEQPLSPPISFTFVLSVVRAPYSACLRYRARLATNAL